METAGQMLEAVLKEFPACDALVMAAAEAVLAAAPADLVTQHSSQHAAGHRQVDLHAGGAGVLGDVVQRLLQGAENRGGQQAVHHHTRPDPWSTRDARKYN